MINHFRRHDRRDPRNERRDTLLARLAEAEETLQALRKGDLDALVVQGADGDQVYTLHGAEEPYRRLVEQMREGAVVLGPAGEILYANAQFAAANPWNRSRADGSIASCRTPTVPISWR